MEEARAALATLQRLGGRLRDREPFFEALRRVEGAVVEGKPPKARRLQTEVARELAAEKARVRDEVQALRRMEEEREASMRAMDGDRSRLMGRSREALKAIAAGERRAAALRDESERLRGLLARRQAEVEEWCARNEAAEREHLPPRVAVANRVRLQRLQDEHASAQFRLRQARAREAAIERHAESIRNEQHHLQTQMEIVEQAVASMHSTVDATAAELLRGEPEPEPHRQQATGAAAAGTVAAAGGTGAAAAAAAGGGHARRASVYPRHRRMLKGRGTGPDVPVFLRHDGMVRHVPFSKRNVELLIKELWALKTMSSQRRAQLGDPDLSLAEFFHRYTGKLFPQRERRVEFCYNFVGGLHLYMYDADVEMFYKTLFGEMSEQYYYDQIAMSAHLKKLLEDMDCADGLRDGLILKEVFFRGLALFFPYKAEPALQALTAIVLRNDITDGRVDVNKLLAENDEGDQSEFVEEVRDQYLSEVFQFPGELQAALHEADSDGDGLLTAGQVAAVLQEVDPNKPAHEVREYMARGIGGEDYADSTPVRIDEWTGRLQRDLVHRSGHWVPDVDVEELRRVARDAAAAARPRRAAARVRD